MSVQTNKFLSKCNTHQMECAFL